MRLRPPVKWYGGKYYLAPRIVKHFPEHRVYLEPFGPSTGAQTLILSEGFLSAPQLVAASPLQIRF